MSADRGKENVADYPRPPRIEDCDRRVRVVFNGATIADTTRAKRVLEKGHAPTYYIPPEDVDFDRLEPTERTTWCEWKGSASYYTVRVGEREAEDAAWTYPDPVEEFREIEDYVSFYPALMDECLVGEERAEPQPGEYYGGWVTSEIEGPFRG